jgi:hypothetical protein
MAGNAVDIGYITSDGVSSHYQATSHLVEMNEATMAWNTQFNNLGRGTVNGGPVLETYEMGPRVKNLNFLPRKLDSDVTLSGKTKTTDDNNFFKPFVT